MGHYFLNDDNLKSQIREYKTIINNYEFKFKTDNGVFSKDELDFGSWLLINTVLKLKITGKVLDLGCGYGPIGIILNKLLNVYVTMIDINKRAIHLANMNIKENNCINIQALVSDGFLNVNNKYDYIISNPPIRIGKDKLYSLIKTAKNYLNENGTIYIVIRKEQGAKSFINDFENEFEMQILEKKKGFYIISLKNQFLS